MEGTGSSYVRPVSYTHLLVKANYLDFIDRFEADPVEALQPVCAPFTEAEDYSWRIHVDEQMVERYGTVEQLAEYRRQAELRGTPECKAKTHTGKLLFYPVSYTHLDVYKRQSILCMRPAESSCSSTAGPKPSISIASREVKCIR